MLAPERIHQVERAVRLDQLQARTDEAVTRIVEQRAELTASSEYTARIEREAQAEPEPDVQAETAYEIDLSCRSSSRACITGIRRLG